MPNKEIKTAEKEAAGNVAEAAGTANGPAVDVSGSATAGAQPSDAGAFDSNKQPSGNTQHSNFVIPQRVKAVAVPLFKLMPDAVNYFKVTAAMYVGKKIDEKKEAATLLPVIDLRTGETGQVIVGQVMKELIAENYPNNAYVGKSFEMTLRKRADKKYNTYDLFEVAGS